MVQVRRWVIPGFALFFYLSFFPRAELNWEGRSYFALFDEAYAMLQVARNFIETGYLGLSLPALSIGQGYSSLLWLIVNGISSYLATLLGASPAFATQCLSLGFLLGNLSFIKQIARKLSNDSLLVTTLSGILTAFYFPLVYLSLGGLETAMVAFFLSGSFYFAIERKRKPLSLFVFLLLLTRLDAILLVAPILYYRIAWSGHRPKWKTEAFLGGAVLLAFLLTLGIRSFAHGSIWMNGATVGISVESAKSAAKLFFEHLYPLVVFSLPLLVIQQHRLDKRLLVVILMAGLQIGYGILLGNTAWSVSEIPSREVVVIVPLLGVVSMVGLNDLRRILHREVSVFYRTVFLFIFVVLVWGPFSGRALPAWFGGVDIFGREKLQIQSGLFIRKNTLPHAVIAVPHAGAATYFSERPVMDLSGRFYSPLLEARRQEQSISGQKPSQNQATLQWIERNRPAVLVGLWRPKVGDYPVLRKIGYERVPANGMYVLNEKKDQIRPLFLSAHP